MSFEVSADAYLLFMLTARFSYPSFEQWWETFTLGVGPAGSYLTGLTAGRADALRERCRGALPAGPVEIVAVAWTATGTVPAPRS